MHNDQRSNAVFCDGHVETSKRIPEAKDAFDTAREHYVAKGNTVMADRVAVRSVWLDDYRSGKVAEPTRGRSSPR